MNESKEGRIYKAYDSSLAEELRSAASPLKRFVFINGKFISVDNNYPNDECNPEVTLEVPKTTNILSPEVVIKLLNQLPDSKTR